MRFFKIFFCFREIFPIDLEKFDSFTSSWGETLPRGGGRYDARRREGMTEGGS